MKNMTIMINLELIGDGIFNVECVSPAGKSIAEGATIQEIVDMVSVELFDDALILLG